ncbi:DUF6230 family protein [Streptomyces sp. TLI_185]|uniref:DUF6230 family protein n=1 Tax=Streptomyces sp. TLI_185 TaxID=2485151 RepID=UPI000F4E1C4B|nr:DUF6230 family protein [Streptomyces sp. TLI_185]RPF36339.1 hypothetical protein EDD92_6375 [Streptomyces sp. TLI_185]
MESQVRGGTRWKRFAVVMVPSVAATAAIGVALAQGALAASFSVSGQQFKVSADSLEGDGFEQYGAVDAGYTLEGKSTVRPVAVSAFNSAKITNLCQSVVTPNVPIFGKVSLILRAGDPRTGAKEVEADKLYIDLDDLSADATFSDINIGVAAKSATKGPGIAENDKTNPNGFAQEARHASLTGVKQTAWATTAGTFKLSGLRMSISTDAKECY